MSLNTRPLKLSSKDKKKRYIVPLQVLVGALFVVIGIITVGVNIEPITDVDCEKDNCKRRSLAVSLPDKVINKSDISRQKLDLVAAKKILASSNENYLIEKKRMSLQSDLEGALNSNVSRMPFNHREGGSCLLKLKYPKRETVKLVISRCSDHVLKRTVANALAKTDYLKIFSNYDFKKQQMEFTVRVY